MTFITLDSEYKILTEIFFDGNTFKMKASSLV